MSAGVMAAVSHEDCSSSTSSPRLAPEYEVHESVVIGSQGRCPAPAIREASPNRLLRFAAAGSDTGRKEIA